ncbi:dipeptidyl aminopeptidase/acylaminoacyl peptidase [Microbacterium phyllosphaerae]|uniref:Dipeptidyl aminopeptidase/acylaminoacyl peptidase n=1 Tax=Microbacterium phyllosphaerae TaxID=124798 RepID=A0ABS4WSY4_9MICO|nr:prolyl oligopeptidase family serine peptidase [Microbacterium phyllosphaerae]MBP2379326.1 dipeptidyl aminopeptidase/acylaminoacyl peptidase [Microbacterium phyllosphaerae]
MSSPFGSWPSPFSPARIAAASPRIDGAAFVGDDIWWGESVPAERGRFTVRSSSGDEILPAPWSARSRVHEYGGGAWTADADGTLFFVDAQDQRVHRLTSGASPVPLTPTGPAHGGLRLQQGRLFAVREDLTSTPHRRGIIEIPVDGSAADDPDRVRVVAEGTAFVAHPSLSPDGSRVAWVEWTGDRMPWQHATLVISDGSARTEVPTQAALQPEWIDDQELLFSDDPRGRWALHRQRLDHLRLDGAAAPVDDVDVDADTGYGLWVLGNRWYRPLADGRIVTVRTNGRDEVVVIDRDGGARRLDIPADGHVSVDAVSGSRVLLTGNSSTTSQGAWCVDVESGSAQVVAGASPVHPEWMPRASELLIDGAHGNVHAFVYPPSNPQASASGDELPPYIVLVHGGPTAHVTGASSAAIAFYTSRGIGVLDVNYGGSTGYGRAYRERLDGRWGVVDVDDVIAAARELADAGLADPARIAIRGGSAGGWTVLSALVRGGVFAAGISRYAVADLRMLAEHSHDFEAHYVEGLVGPLPAAEALYVDRSPLTHAARIAVPVLLMQGSDDRVVPPSQSEAIRDALAANGVDHEYVLYQGEGHGFRSAETIVDALERELSFLGRVFGFTPSF